MRIVPIDEQRFAAKAIALLEIVPENDFDSGVQKSTPQGIPIWKVRILTREGDDPTRRPDITEVKVPHPTEPKLDPAIKPLFGGLVGLVWQSNNSGGVSFRADSMATTERPSIKRDADKAAA